MMTYSTEIHLPTTAGLLATFFVHLDMFLLGLSIFLFFSDTSSFSISLSPRRDRGFHTYRQLCMFLLTLRRPCIHPGCLPPKSDLSGILRLGLTETTALKVSAFLSQLGSKLDNACRLMAEKERRETEHEGRVLE